MAKELIFVYNADSGKWNGYMDIMHKIFLPKTYPCSLCAITHGTFSIRESWKEFIDNSPVTMHFLHRDEWEEQYNRKGEQLPAVFLKEAEAISTWLDAPTLNSYSLEDLQNHIKNNLPELVEEKEKSE